MADQHAAALAPKPEVVVLGGGIAGIATALHLLDEGYPVTLVEARRYLGGRVFSFPDHQTGVPVDNGQHVFVGCCTYFIELLKRLGIFQRWYLQPRLRLGISDRRGKVGFLTASVLPAPFHLFPSLLAYPHLGFGDKIWVLTALARAKLTNRHQPHLEEMSFYEWLKRRGQSERAIQNLWNLVVMPILNDDVRDVSAAMGLMIVQEGMLAGCHSADLGYAADGLLPAIGEPAKEHLSTGGVKLLLGSSVRRLVLENGRIAGAELASGDTVTGQIYVSSLPFDMLCRLLPTAMVEQPFFQRLKELQTSPIVNLHLWYDRPVMEESFCAFVDSPLQWVFNKTKIMSGGAPNEAVVGSKPAPRRSRTSHADPDASPGSGMLAEGGQYICISLSAAWEYIDQPREELTRRFIAEMAQVFSRAKDAVVEQAIVVKQRHATFRCLPGASFRRPGSRTPIPNLFLAGEWTDTGWPSTMESAARSGYNAAQAIGSSEEVSR